MRTAVVARFRVTSSIDGTPIAGVRLDVCDSAEKDEPMALVTDSGGTARAANVRDWKNLRVIADAKGFVRSRTNITADECADVIVLQLEPGCDVVGGVVDDASGDPIEGARVEALGSENVSGESGHDARIVIGRATTDAAGRFVLEGFPVPARGAYACVSAARHMAATFTCDTVQPEPVVVRLDPAGRVRGVVRTSDGKPVADATVAATQHDHLEGDNYREWAATDDDGRFVVDHLRLGVGYELSATVGGFAATSHGDLVVTSPSTPEVVHDLVLRGPASLTVVVVSPDGTAAPTANVVVRRADRTDYAQPVTAGPDGARFDALEPGAVTAHAWSDGTADTTVDVSLSQGETKRITIQLLPMFVIAGVVVDDAGAPVGGATVQARDEAGGMQMRPAETKSGADGAFRLLTRTGGERTVAVRAGNHRGDAVSAAPGDAGVRLILPRMAPMSVRLAGAGADVAVRFDALDEQGVEIDESYASRKQDDDADWIVDLPLLARQVRLHVDGYVDVVLAVHPVLGKTTDLGTVTLDRGAGVAGRVIACDGLALGNATVSIVGADGETGLADVSLGPDGVFEVHGLAQGSVQVRVASDGYVAVSVSAEARVEPTPLKITLRHGCLLRVRVLDADKLAALCDQIDALAADGAPATDGFSSVKAGTYEQRVPAGRWRIVATRGDLRAEETVDTADGATREVTLRLGR